MIAALEKIGTPAVRPLCEVLGDLNRTVYRVNATYVLGKIGDAAAVKALCEARQDPEERVRYSADRADFNHDGCLDLVSGGLSCL